MSIQRTLRGLGRFDALVLTSLIWFLAKFLRYAFPPLFDTLETSYGVSTTVVGAAFTGFMLVYAAMQFPAGLLADRLGSIQVITAGVLATATAALALVVDAPLAVLVAAMVGMGAGTGAHKTVAVSLLSRAYPSRTGRALGFHDTFGTFGGVAAPAVVVVVVGTVGPFGEGWRTLFLGGAVLGIGLGAAFFVRVRRRLPDESGAATGAPTGIDLEGYAILFRDRRLAAFVAVTVLFSFAYNGIVAFTPLYLTREAGLSDAAANLIYSGLFAVSFVQLGTGELSDRIGPLPVIVATLGLATAALVALVALTGVAGPLALGAAVVVVGLGSHGFRPVRGSYLMSALPADVAGGSFGIVRTLLMGAGAVAPAVVGYLSETAGFQPAFSLLAGSLTVATGVAVLLWIPGSGETAPG